MWLRLGPVLQSGEDAVVALDDPVLLNGERLNFSGGDGHAETDLQNPTTYWAQHHNKNIFVYSKCPRRALMLCLCVNRQGLFMVMVFTIMVFPSFCDKLAQLLNDYEH